MPLFKTQPYLVFIQDFCLGFCFVFFYKRDPFRNKGQVSQTSVGRALAFPSWGLLLTTASSFYLWLHLSCRQLGPALETWATEHPGCDQSWWPAPGVFPSWAFHSRCTYPSWACQPPASLPPLPTSAPAPWPAHPTSASRSPGRDRVGKGLKTTLSPYSTSPIASQAHRSRAPHKQSKIQQKAVLMVEGWHARKQAWLQTVASSPTGHVLVSSDEQAAFYPDTWWKPWGPSLEYSSTLCECMLLWPV